MRIISEQMYHYFFPPLRILLQALEEKNEAYTDLLLLEILIIAVLFTKWVKFTVVESSV